MSDVQVKDNPEGSRFEAWIGDKLAGFAEYRMRPGTIVFTHTEVGDAFEGMGVGSALARGALDATRPTLLGVEPQCPFIKGYIDKHPEYQDLVRAGD